MKNTGNSPFSGSDFTVMQFKNLQIDGYQDGLITHSDQLEDSMELLQMIRKLEKSRWPGF